MDALQMLLEDGGKRREQRHRVDGLHAEAPAQYAERNEKQRGVDGKVGHLDGDVHAPVEYR